MPSSSACRRSRSPCGSSLASPTSTARSAGPPKSTQHRYGLVATGSADGRVVAHAGWEREPDRPERAEVAFAIADATQHNGLGTILLGQLIEAADQAGVAVLTAEVLPQNQHMLHLFRDSGFPVTTRTLPGVVLVELPTSRSPTTPEFERCEPPRTSAL